MGFGPTPQRFTGLLLWLVRHLEVQINLILSTILLQYLSLVDTAVVEDDRKRFLLGVLPQLFDEV